MKSRAFFAIAIAGLALLASNAWAQDTPDEPEAPQGDIAGPLPRVGVRCYKLQDVQNQCFIADKSLINYKNPVFNVIDLNGAWVDQSGNRPYIYLFSDSGSSSGYAISVDLSLMNRPNGVGYVVDGLTISVYFPDDSVFTGTIEQNGRQISWSNNTVWRKQ